MFSPDHPRLKVFDGIPKRHLKSSSEDGLQLLLLVGLSET